MNVRRFLAYSSAGVQHCSVTLEALSEGQKKLLHVSPSVSNIMFLLAVLLVGPLLCLPEPCHAVDYEYYEYYYEDGADLPPQVPAKEDKAEEEKPDYDISELVKAWKEYIREKAENDDREDERPSKGSGDGRRKRPRPRPRPVAYEDYEYEDERPSKGSGRRKRPRPQPVEFEDYEYECEPRSEAYRYPDPEQCDKYKECNIKGEETEKLCPDGLVFEEKAQHCDYPSKVVCGNRTKLQPPQPTKNCPRANGFFAWPAEESCQKFWDCRGGTSYLQICPEGVIFDMKIDSCVTPDQSVRPECRAEKFLKYDCPTYTDEDTLRFGNHDRLPDPDNCQKFYSCLRDGQPRLGVCPRKTVFNNATGLCDDPKAVPSCEDFWKDKEESEFLDYYDYT